MIYAMPIAWLPWGPAVFARAQAERKPVLLSIGATWCHWCHVQERTVFADPAIAEKVGALTVPVRIDTDHRPDINERYNQGGWPTTVFLTPEGAPITGGTYIPPEEFTELLDQLALLYSTLASPEPVRLPEPISGALEPRIVSWVAEKLELGFDPEFGGWGFGQKFPMAEALRFLLERGQAALALKTAEGMQGLFDKEAGGFYRYAVERNWTVPHYEKMLETNAELLEALSLLFERTKTPELKACIDKTIAYLTTTLYRPGGGFWGSQDSDGEEAYYGLPLAERAKKEQPFIDKTVYCEWNGLALRGLAVAWRATGNPACKAALEETIPFLLKECWKDGAGFCRSFDSTGAQTFGLLLDNVQVGFGLLAAGLALGREEWLAAGRATAELILAQFEVAAGGFRDRLPQQDDAGLLAQELLPFLGNSRAARFLLALAKETKEQRYAAAARKALERFAGSYLRSGIMAAEYASAVAMALLER